MKINYTRPRRLHVMTGGHGFRLYLTLWFWGRRYHRMWS